MEIEKEYGRMKGVIFDLDGVIVDTAKYHYLAWKELAEELGFSFDQEQNERLKGVSRMASLEIILELGGFTGMSQVEKEALADRKNRRYVELAATLTQVDILPGISLFLRQLKQEGYRIALGSASKSGRIILERLGLTPYFDAVVDGQMVQKAKPDPEVFLTAARLLELPASGCIVIEDSQAGLKAAKAGGMKTIGIGSPEHLTQADLLLADTSHLPDSEYRGLLK